MWYELVNRNGLYAIQMQSLREKEVSSKQVTQCYFPRSVNKSHLTPETDAVQKSENKQTPSPHPPTKASRNNHLTIT